MQGQWRAQAAWLDEALGRAPCLAGDAPGLADIAAYMNLWFLGGAVPKTTEALIGRLRPARTTGARGCAPSATASAAR